MTSLNDGGFDFAAMAHGDLSQETIVWTEEAFPRVLRGTKLFTSAVPAPPTFRLSDLHGAHIWAEADKLDVVWSTAGGPHRVIAGRIPDIDAIILPLDEAFQTRLDAAYCFWRSLTGRSSGPGYGTLPCQTKARHILNLRAHDGRRAGATYRNIAETLLSRDAIPPREWRDHHLKQKVRAILRRAERLIAGGYRDLLLYPHSRRKTLD